MELYCFDVQQLSPSRLVDSNSVFTIGVRSYSLVAVFKICVSWYILIAILFCVCTVSFFAEMRPAELYFQMHLLARELKVGPNFTSSMESSQSPMRWVIRAIHMNPSCMRYWKVLQKLME